METERQPVRSWITDGIIIALATATAYLWTLFYEIGFCDYFNIPYYFISLNTTTVLATSGEFILAVLILYLFIAGPLHMSQQINNFINKSSIRRFIIGISIIFFFTLVSLIFLVSDKERRQTWTIIAIFGAAAIAAAIIVFFVKPLFTQRDKEGSYWEKLIADLPPTERTGLSGSSLAQRHMHFSAIVIIFIVVISISVGAYAHRKMGQSNAQRQEWFLVVAQSPEVVVLRNYSDYLFASPINRSTKEIEKKLFILKISEMTKIPLTTEKVGPLRVKP